jgi:hypothetical protein
VGLKLAQIPVQMAALVEVVTDMELLLELKLVAQEFQAKVLLEDWGAQEPQDILLEVAEDHQQLEQIIQLVKPALAARVLHLA